MKKSNILIRAKHTLWDGEELNPSKYVFICHAIENAVPNRFLLSNFFSGDKKRINQLKAEVMDTIAPCETVGLWIYKNRPDKFVNLSNIQYERHKILDQMIDKYQQKGE